jgi:hypothetical protein
MTLFCVWGSAMRAQVMSAGGEMGMMEEVYRRMDSERQQRIAIVDAMSEAEVRRQLSMRCL